MELTHLMRLIPTMDMVAEELEEAGIFCQRFIPRPDRSYRAVMPYTGQSRLAEDILYLVGPEQDAAFPADRASCVCTRAIPGRENRLCCPGRTAEELMQRILELFCRFQEQEAQLNQLLFSGEGLDDLCQLGQELTGCPVCIHDDWFILIAMSEGAEAIMPPEGSGGSGRGFIPRSILEEFKFDTDYEQTFAQQRCQLWVNSPDLGRCLYVNLWQDRRYRGRLLYFESRRALKSADYLMAECLAQRAMLLLLRQKPGARPHRNLDDVIYALLEGRDPGPGDLRFLLDTLRWGAEDSYLCVRLQTQQEDVAGVLGHVLHSDLFRAFPGSYVMFLERQQCLVLNLTREEPGFQELRHRISPLCMDYGLYGGISSPVRGIRALDQAAKQADIALERAFELRGADWVQSFSDCALEYMLGSIHSGLEPRYLAAPEWLALRSYDRDHDTRYFETLRTYLLMERDIPKTAKALIIHRTTLIYRLNKIRALTGLDLEDPDLRLYLLLSLRLLERQRLVGEA